MVLAGEIYVLLSDYVPKKFEGNIIYHKKNLPGELIIKLLLFFLSTGTLFDAQN